MNTGTTIDYLLSCGLSSPQMHIMIIIERLAWRNNGCGEIAFATNGYLSRIIGKSETATKDSIRELIRKGILKRVKIRKKYCLKIMITQQAEGGENQPHTYKKGGGKPTPNNNKIQNIFSIYDFDKVGDHPADQIIKNVEPNLDAWETRKAMKEFLLNTRNADEIVFIHRRQLIGFAKRHAQIRQIKTNDFNNTVSKPSPKKLENKKEIKFQPTGFRKYDQLAQDLLKDNQTKGTFHAWFENATPIDDTTLKMPTPFVANWVKIHLDGILRKYGLTVCT